MQDTETTIGVTIAGSGPEAARWVAALRGIDNVQTHRIDTASDADMIAHLAETTTDALVLVAPVADLQGAIKRAIMARRHVLVAGPTALASKQLTATGNAARSRGRVLMFDTGHLGDDRVAFVRRMTAGQQALWHPRYVRSLRTGADPSASLDELAIADIAAVLSLLGGSPSRVTAVAPRVDDESGGADVAMVTLLFDGGPAARIDVSLMEPEPRHEVVLACDGRTIVLDAFDTRAPIKIQAAARHRGPQHTASTPNPWAETVTEHPVAEQGDRLARAAQAFVQAVRSRDVVQSNADELATASLVWETARESISRGGEVVAMPTPDVRPSKRPALQLIHGGGHTTVAPSAPELTLLPREVHESA